MSSLASPTKALESHNAVLFGVIGSLIVAAILYAGPWLANRFVPDEVALQYRFSEQSAGNISSLHLQIINSTDVAFDIAVTPPKGKLVRTTFSAPTQSSPSWIGVLEKSKKFEALYIVEDAGERMPSELVKRMISAKYDGKNSATGITEKKDGVVKEAGFLGYGRTAVWFLVFLIPVTLFGLLMWGWGWVIRLPRRRTENTESSAAG